MGSDVPIWAAVLIGVVTAAVTTAFTLLVDQRRYLAARRERLEQWRFEASRNYLRAVLAAFRMIETAAKWIQEGTHQDLIEKKVEDSRIAREERWATHTELIMTCAPGLQEWFDANYSEIEARVEKAFHETYRAGSHDYSGFWGTSHEWRNAFRQLTQRLRDEMRKKVD